LISTYGLQTKQDLF